jgi:hypothetical protein
MGVLGMKHNDKGIVPNNYESFAEIVAIIERSRENAFRAVNRELINMYWILDITSARK